MASTTFDISAGADVQDSSTLTLGAGEVARVRFTALTGSVSASYGITRNAVTTYHPLVNALDGDAAEPVVPLALEGDVVFVRVRLNGNAASRATGILETI